MLTSATPPRKVFDTIQILRGLAALIVVLFHLSLGNERRGQQPLVGGLFQNGFAGVDLFFVISGFVIMHTSHRYFSTPDYFGVYIRKRLIRIYPIYWITFVVIVGGILLVEFITKKSAGFLPTSWDSLLSAFFLLPNHPNVNGVTWSLSFELYYYLLFGLLILSRQLWLFIAVVLSLSGAATLDPTLFAPYPLLVFFFSPYNLEFASGVLIWWLLHQYKFSTPVCFLLLLISGVWLLVNKSTLFEEPAKRTILYGTSSFLLVLSFTGLERNGWFRPSGLNRLLMKIGDASYLIYIFHFPFLPFYGRLLNTVHSVSGQHLAAALFAVVIVVVCIDLHRRFEAPVVKKLNVLFEPVSPKPDNG